MYTFAEQSLINFSERVEQDIPESCMLAKMNSKEDFESDCRFSSSNKTDLNEEQAVKEHKLKWSQSSLHYPNSHDSPNTYDEIILRTFKQRVIEAFSVVSL
ncbi:hypothetical protein VYA_33060 [Vibrio alfacsensis]|nr:hypothetical protein VYA_33060 [Vibrio alfacsensis]